MELNARIYVDDEDLNEAICVLDEHSVDNDLDGGNRIMVAEETLDNAIMCLEDSGIDCDVV